MRNCVKRWIYICMYAYRLIEREYNGPMRSRLFSLRFRIIFHCMNWCLVPRVCHIESFVSHSAFNSIVIFLEPIDQKTNVVSEPLVFCGKRLDSIRFWFQVCRQRRRCRLRHKHAPPADDRPLHHFSLFRNYCRVCFFSRWFFFFSLCFLFVLRRATCPSHQSPAPFAYIVLLFSFPTNFFAHDFFIFRGQKTLTALESFLALDPNLVLVFLRIQFRLSTRRHKLYNCFLFLRCGAVA